MSLSAFDAAVKVVFLALSEEPGEVAAAGGELIEARHNPAEGFVHVVALGNSADLGAESSEIVVHAAALAHQRVATDDAHVPRAFDFVADNARHRCADKRFHVGRRGYHGTSHGDAAGEVHLARTEELAKHNHVLSTHGPYGFALVHGVDMIDLHAHVAGGVRAGKDADLCMRDGQQFRVDLLRVDAHVNRRDAREGGDARLEVAFPTLCHKREVGCKRHGAECRHENRLGLLLGVGNHVVGTLAQEGGHACFEHQGVHFFAGGLLGVGRVKRLVVLLAVALDADAQELAAFAALDGFHRAADGADYCNFLGGLVHKKRVAGFYAAALFHRELGHDSVEIGRLHGIRFCQRTHCELLLGRAFEHDVKTFLNLIQRFHSEKYMF